MSVVCFSLLKQCVNSVEKCFGIKSVDYFFVMMKCLFTSVDQTLASWIFIVNCAVFVQGLYLISFSPIPYSLKEIIFLISKILIPILNLCSVLYEAERKISEKARGWRVEARWGVDSYTSEF